MRPDKKFHYSKFKKRRGEGFVFFRLLFIFGVLALFVLGGITAISFIFQNVIRGIQGGHPRPFDGSFYLILFFTNYTFIIIMKGHVDTLRTILKITHIILFRCVLPHLLLSSIVRYKPGRLTRPGRSLTNLLNITFV